MSYFFAWRIVDDKLSLAAPEMDRENSCVSAGMILEQTKCKRKQENWWWTKKQVQDVLFLRKKLINGKLKSS